LRKKETKSSSFLWKKEGKKQPKADNKLFSKYSTATLMQKPQNERQAPGNLKAAEVVLRREVNVSAVLSIKPRPVPQKAWIWFHLVMMASRSSPKTKGAERAVAVARS